MPPARSFLLLCRLNIHWPKLHRGDQKYEHQNWLLEGKDSRCDQILAETKHMGEFEANSHFCGKSAAAKAIMNGEKYSLTSPA